MNRIVLIRQLFGYHSPKFLRRSKIGVKQELNSKLQAAN